METKDIIFELRTKNGLSQDELAEKIFVTRQAVLYRESRKWNIPRELPRASPSGLT